MANAVLTKPKAKRKVVRRTGADALIAQTLLSQGLTQRTVANITGIPKSTVGHLGHSNVIAPEHVERVKQNLKNRFAILADQCLNAVDDDRLAKASLGELVKAAATAATQAGITTSVHEHFHSVMGKYSVQVVTQQTGMNTGDQPRAISLSPGDIAVSPSVQHDESST